MQKPVFNGITLTIEDRRFDDYGEQRFITLGLLRDIVVVIAHIETASTIRIISMGKGTRREETLYFENIQADALENRLASCESDGGRGHRPV